MQKWPNRDLELIAQVLSQPQTVEELKERSPVRLDPQKNHAETILAALFPPDALICIGKTLNCCRVGQLRGWRGLPEASPFMVPSPMTKSKGFSRKGKLTPRCLDNTGPRWHVVIEFDDGAAKDEQATKLLHLAQFAPLVEVHDSGGKSLHGWFRCKDVPEALTFAFMRYAVRLGADYAPWSRCQLVRVPDGLRDNGNRQTAYYFDPSAAEENVQSRWHIPPEWLSPEPVPEQADCTQDPHVPQDPQDPQAVLLLSSLPLPELKNALDLVLFCLPSKPHETNDKLFDLARGALTLEREMVRRMNPKERTALFDLWWKKADPAYLTRPKGVYLMEFMANCTSAKVPLGQASLQEAWHRVRSNPLPKLPEILLASENERLIQLAALCRELQLVNGEKPFFLSCRDIARLQGHPHHSTPALWMKTLQGMGVIEPVLSDGLKVGSSRLAKEYRYLGPLD